MLDRLFLDHPAAVGESHGEHGQAPRALNDHLVQKRGNDSARNGGWVI
jgi:hypothetical protein